MKTEQGPIVRVTHSFSAPAERVFDAFLDPDRAGKFMFATDTGEMVRVEIDARVGGRYVFVDRRNGEDVEHTGEYVEIDRPRRLVFTFGVPKYSPDSNLVTIEISPAPSGCEVTLTQQMNPEWSDWADKTQQGWTMILTNMEKVLG